MKRRPEEIKALFFETLDNHLANIIAGKTDVYLEIQEMADILHIHPTHLSNTIKETTGKSPCLICHERTIVVAKKLLALPNSTISSVAFKLTFEPTHFTKYFKKHTGLTPSQFKKTLD